MALAPGTRLDHYEILSLLGVGGMGEVYLAQDLKLSRKVALKLLPAKFTTDLDRIRRFEQEARAVSALNHPNLVTIFDIGQADVQHFMAYEYIDGQSLRERLKQEKLALSGALDLAIQIASALNAAHEAGIIHRDIKPDNIMLRRDGIVKVLDFGLAKLTEERTQELAQEVDKEAETRAKLTTDPGTVMGTPQYMSPEQARGQKADARTDIFSLGCVLYEMLAGRAAFDGVNPLDVISAILRAEPAPLKEAVAEVPQELAHQLEHIVSKALRKDRDERYQTSKDLLIDLRDFKEELAFAAKLSRNAERGMRSAESTATVQPAAVTEETLAASTIPSLQFRIPHSALRLGALLAVIVLAAVAAFFYFNRKPVLTDKDTILLTDFTNTTGDAVFDGTLKQALAVHLGQSPFLNLFADERVRETLRLMNRSPDERVTREVGREICQRQGLKAMLAGTIASLGRNYVINLEAVNGQTGDVLAREQAEAEGKEQVVRKLGEAASKLREKLGESLSSIRKFDEPLEQATTSSLEALRAFSQGNEQRTKGLITSGVPFYKRAVELDPNFALAWAHLSYYYNYTDEQELATQAAEKAYALRERTSERERFYITWSYYRDVARDIDKQIETLELWRQTYPREALPHQSLAALYNVIGSYERAIEEGEEAIRLDPTYARGYSVLARSFICLNRFDEAKEICQRALQQKMQVYFPLYDIAFIQGDEAVMRQVVERMKGNVGEADVLNMQGEMIAWTGRLHQSREVLDRAFELYLGKNQREYASWQIALQAEKSAIYGQCQQVRAAIARVGRLPLTQYGLFGVGIARAFCGDVREAQTVADEMTRRYPKDWDGSVFATLVRAAIAIQRGNPDQALQILQTIERYESATYFYLTYLRGQAYLAQHKGAEAAAQFQRILDHRGWSAVNALYVPSYVWLARAATLQGDTAKARKSYQDFFALWKDADADLPVLLEAKQEYEKLK